MHRLEPLLGRLAQASYPRGLSNFYAARRSRSRVRSGFRALARPREREGVVELLSGKVRMVIKERRQ
jgi:hypothetical protein